MDQKIDRDEKCLSYRMNKMSKLYKSFISLSKTSLFTNIPGKSQCMYILVAAPLQNYSDSR